MTATVPPVQEPSASAQSGPDLGKTLRTLMPISVNLLPDEVVRARAAASSRRVTVIALIVVAALMGGWYFQAHEATSNAQDTLDQANAQTTIATHAQLKYTGVTKSKVDIQTIAAQLKQVTKGDVAWAALVARIRTQLPKGLLLTGVTATAAAGQQTPDPSGAPGTVVLNGNSPTESGVHQFADRLSSVTGVSNAFVTSVAAAEDKKGLTFSISLLVNKKSLNTRYVKAGTR